MLFLILWIFIIMVFSALNFLLFIRIFCRITIFPFSITFCVSIFLTGRSFRYFCLAFGSPSYVFVAKLRAFFVFSFFFNLFYCLIFSSFLF